MKSSHWSLLRVVLCLQLAGCTATETDTIEASGTVEATEAHLGFQVSGRIDSILTIEGAKVSSGDRLATLDRSELSSRLEAAKASLEAQRARLRELENGFRSQEVAQARAALVGAERRLTDALRDRDRARNLFAGGAVSQQALDRAETAATLAETDAARAREQVGLMESGARPEQVSAQRAAVTQAGAQVRQVEAALRFAEIVAPFPGILTRRHREPGEIVAAGVPVFSLMNPADRWVRIYIPEARIAQVPLGARAEMVVDGFPDRRYDGEVVFIADEAEFTPRTVQTREERIKLVYRVKVRVIGDDAMDLKPGLTVDLRFAGGQ